MVAAEGLLYLGCQQCPDSTTVAVGAHAPENGADQEIRFAGKSQHREVHGQLFGIGALRVG